MGTQSELSKKIENAGLDLPSSNGKELSAAPAKPSSMTAALKQATKDFKELSAKAGGFTKLEGEELAAAKELKSEIETVAKMIP